MPELKSELAQHALQIALRQTSDPTPSDELMASIRDNVKLFYNVAEDACPRCWAESSISNILEVTARASDCDEYTCDTCGFKGVFAKLN